MYEKEINQIQTLILVKGGTVLTDKERQGLECLLDTIYLDGRIGKLKELQKELKA